MREKERRKGRKIINKSMRWRVPSSPDKADQNVLKNDSESVFQTYDNPGPSAEVEFWVSKASNLNGIFDQLQSPQSTSSTEDFG